MSSAIRKAFDTIRQQMTDSEILRAIQSGSIDSYFEKALSDASLSQAFAPVRDTMRDSIYSGAKYFSKDIPKPKNVLFGFDTLDPNVVVAIKTLETAVITDLSDSIRETVRLRVQQGLVDGESPKSIGRALRETIGLPPSAVEDSAKYREKLAEKFNAEKVDRMVATYERRRIAQNSETIARTAVLDAQKLAQKLSYDQAVSAGIVNGATLMKRWVGVMDDRERDEHVAMEGEEVPFDESYSNGEDVPGESTYNCRCVSRFFQAQ